MGGFPKRENKNGLFLTLSAKCWGSPEPGPWALPCHVPFPGKTSSSARPQQACDAADFHVSLQPIPPNTSHEGQALVRTLQSPLHRTPRTSKGDSVNRLLPSLSPDPVPLLSSCSQARPRPHTPLMESEALQLSLILRFPSAHVQAIFLPPLSSLSRHCHSPGQASPVAMLPNVFSFSLAPSLLIHSPVKSLAILLSCLLLLKLHLDTSRNSGSL